MFYVAAVILVAVPVNAWVRHSSAAVRPAIGVVLERAATESYVQEVSGGCNVLVPEDEGGNGERKNVQCWSLWMVSDDGGTRLRLARAWGPNAEEWLLAVRATYIANSRMLTFDVRTQVDNE
jgi:hypothetical protein